MPTEAVFSEGRHRGVRATFTKTTGKLVLDGWYDQICHIPGESMTLGEFFEKLGITEKDVRKAFRKQKP